MVPPVSNTSGNETGSMGDTIGSSNNSSKITKIAELAVGAAAAASSGNVIVAALDSAAALAETVDALSETVSTLQEHHEINKIVDTETNSQLDDDLDSLRKL